jgi:hypothetical protein
MIKPTKGGALAMLDLPMLAGAISSAMFVGGTLPMVYKAFATKNLQSYSMTGLLFNNLGNVIHALYVYSLPPGPIWLLHTFYLISTALMLFWYIRYEGWYTGTGRAGVARLAKPKLAHGDTVGSLSVAICCR